MIRTRETEMLTTNPSDAEVLGTIGDVSPIEHGGGRVFETEHGPMLEYTHGMEDDAVVEHDEGATKLQLYRVSIEPDVLTDLNWVKPSDLKSIARSMDTEVSTLREFSKSGDVMKRVRVYEDVAGYWGWDNLDSYPITMTARELDEHWFDGDTWPGPKPVKISYAVYNVFQRYWHGQGDSLYAVLSRRGSSVDWVTVEASEDEIDRLEETANEIIDDDESSAGERRTAEALLKQLEKLED